MSRCVAGVVVDHFEAVARGVSNEDPSAPRIERTVIEGAARRTGMAIVPIVFSAMTASPRHRLIQNDRRMDKRKTALTSSTRNLLECRVLRRAWTERAVWRGVCISPGSVKLIRQERSRKTHIRDRERSIRRDQESCSRPEAAMSVLRAKGRLAPQPPLVAASRMIRESGNRFSLRQREAFARRSCSNELAERNDDLKKGRPGLVAISRRTIGQAGYTGRTAIVWHEGGRSRRKFFRIRVGVRRPVDVAWLRRVRRSISFIEGGVCIPAPVAHNPVHKPAANEAVCSTRRPARHKRGSRFRFRHEHGQTRYRRLPAPRRRIAARPPKLAMTTKHQAQG